MPDGFTIHPKLERQFAQRDELVATGEVDWALAEALAIGSLLYEGVNVRLTGQDTRRGTFSHRHAVLVDYDNGEEYVPLRTSATGCSASAPTRSSRRARWATSPSATRCSRSTPRSASSTATRSRHPRRWSPGRRSSATSPTAREIIIDNFMVAAEDKWGQFASLVLLLPHGYEGQGPSTRPRASSASCR